MYLQSQIINLKFNGVKYSNTYYLLRQIKQVTQ